MKKKAISKSMRNCILLLIITWSAGMASPLEDSRMSRKSSSYPKIGSMWGCWDITRITDYDLWAKWDLLVASGPLNDVGAWQKFSRELKARHPDILLLATGEMTGMGRHTPWSKEEWLLRRPDGSLVSWWDGQITVPNLMRGDTLDAIVQHDIEDWDGILKTGIVDGLFFDSVSSPESYGPFDVDGDGKADNSPEMDRKWMERQSLIFDRLRAHWPKALILANDIRSTHAMHTNGRFYEGGRILDPLMGDDVIPEWSVPDPTVVDLGDGPFDVHKVIQTIGAWRGMSLKPWLTSITMSNPQGWQEFRIAKIDRATGRNTMTSHGEIERCRRDYPRMRLGLLISLMADAYYQFDFGTVWWGLPWWYAEYDAPLGQPVSDAQEVNAPGGSHWERKFEGGLALLNPNHQPVTVKLDQTLRRLSDAEAPRYIVEVDDISSDFSTQGPWEVRKTNERSYGKSWRMNSYRATTEPDSQASWQFTAPSTDTYTVFACLPGGEEFTKSAFYTLTGNTRVGASVDQQKADGDWVKLFEAKLSGGKRYAVKVRSGTGTTAADAIRVESKARYNDGARVKEVTLGGLDGIVLLNP